MKKRKYLNKNEILRCMEQMREAKHVTKGYQFVASCTLCNYSMWKHEHYEDERLADYNQRAWDYAREVFDNSELAKKYNEEIFDKYDFKMEYTEYIARKENSFYDVYLNSIDESNTIINADTQKYFIAHFKVLLDYGFTKEQAGANLDYLQSLVNGITDEESNMFLRDLEKELKEEAGVVFEHPTEL